MCSYCRIFRVERIKYGIYIMHFSSDIFPNNKLVRTDFCPSLCSAALSFSLFLCVATA